MGFYLIQQHALAASYESHEQTHETESQQEKIKIIYLVNYPLGGKTKYLEWVKEIGPILVRAEEVQRIRSYDDNFDGGDPHRLVEIEFNSIEDMQGFQRRSEIRSVLDDISNHTSSSETHTFVQRSGCLKLSP